MIDKLTLEQEALIPAYQEKWNKIALSKAFFDTNKTDDKLALPTANLYFYREQIKHTLTGSQHAVTSTIQVLH